MALAIALRLLAAGLVALALGCERPEPAATAPEPGPASVAVTVGGQRLHLELAADDARRHRGLGGRDHIPENSGMLFAFREAKPRAFVMRDCLIPIDIAFLDAEGRAVAIHSMAVEPPRHPNESAWAYDRRLPRYASVGPAQFALETAGGRLAALGLRLGDRVEFDREAVLRRTQ